MRGSGAAVGLVAIPIAGLVLFVLKIFRNKHNLDLMEMAGLVVAYLAGGVWVGAL
jgi:hypothetical protein